MGSQGVLQKLIASGVFALALVILGNANVARAESEFDKWLAGKPYNEQKLLDEIEDTSDKQFHSAEDSVIRFEASAIALILPLDATGLISDVANAFLEGFIQAAEADGANFALETYRTDGQPNSGLVAYRQAVSNGAGLVVGPLLRSSVDLVARLKEEQTVPTILLQEPEAQTHAGQLGAPRLYSFPLGGEVEIMQFANDAQRSGDWSVFVIVEASALGERMEKTFHKAWRLAGNPTAKVRKVISQDSWKALHDEVRDEISPSTDKDGEGGQEVETSRQFGFHAVFAAGSADFVAQVRANMPSAVPVYMLSSSQESLGQGGRSLLVLDGIRFYEMPYVLDLHLGKKGMLAAAYASDLPLLLQRYVAAGIDAYELASEYAAWGLVGQWEHVGATGLINLAGSRFFREGRLMELDEGVYVDISPKAVLQDEASGENSP